MDSDSFIPLLYYKCLSTNISPHPHNFQEQTFVQNHKMFQENSMLSSYILVVWMCILVPDKTEKIINLYLVLYMKLLLLSLEKNLSKKHLFLVHLFIAL